MWGQGVGNGRSATAAAMARPLARYGARLPLSLVPSETWQPVPTRNRMVVDDLPPTADIAVFRLTISLVGGGFSRADRRHRGRRSTARVGCTQRCTQPTGVPRAPAALRRRPGARWNAVTQRGGNGTPVRHSPKVLATFATGEGLCGVGQGQDGKQSRNAGAMERQCAIRRKSWRLSLQEKGFAARLAPVGRSTAPSIADLGRSVTSGRLLAPQSPRLYVQNQLQRCFNRSCFSPCCAAGKEAAGRSSFPPGRLARRG